MYLSSKLFHMVLFFKRGKGYHQEMRRPYSKGKRSLADVLRRGDSPGSVNTTKHVVLVMDRLKEFTTEPLVWALENILEPGSVVTLLGVTPWLNIPLWLKTSQDIWAVEFEELSILKEKNEWKGDSIKYLQLQEVVDLCKQKGVVPQKEVVTGHPLRLLIVESVTSLHATWVVFDRYHKKNREFYAEKIPCNMVMMNEDGDGDMIRGQAMIDNVEFTPGESPASLAPTPQLMISEDLKEILKEKVPKNHDDDDDQEYYDYII